MKINEILHAAVNDSGEIATTEEGDVIGSKETVKSEMKIWKIDPKIYKIKKVKVVLIDS